MTSSCFISMVIKTSFSQYSWCSRNWGEIWKYIYWMCWEELTTLFNATRLNLGHLVLRNYIQCVVFMLFLSGKYILFQFLYSLLYFSENETNLKNVDSFCYRHNVKESSFSTYQRLLNAFQYWIFPWAIMKITNVPLFL